MKNVVLIGFMGTGKTSTGKALASRIGCAFADVDQRIERAAGMTIKEIFSQKGEACFRQYEKDVVQELARHKNFVISTGGGTVKDPENLALLQQNGIIICLTASLDAILSRTEKHGVRPVLDAHDHGDRRQAIQELLDSRRGIYAQADYTVDTSTVSPLQVTTDIVYYLKREGILHA